MSVTVNSSDIATLEDYAAHVVEVTGGSAATTFGTVKVSVPRGEWVQAITNARDQLGLVFFSWLSGVDWTNEVAVGDPPAEPVEERYEVLCTVADVTDGRRVTFSTDVPKDDAVIDSLVGVFAGANWHEREAHEMFGIEFKGHPDLGNLYLPDAFIGHPLQKSFRLLSRDVKPWPGDVDVEAMPGEDDEASDAPSTENPEA
jgi:NADH-quinone oxidoreductase subunit C